MTWLAPLYLVGALGIAAPIVFHLWRRTPRGRRPFSTLMFLTPSPPRVTTLSKVEHWALLACRALAVLLLALAFARPVWRVPATLPVLTEDREFVAILVDTSASQSRAGIWERVAERVGRRLDELPSRAVVGLSQIDDHWRSVVDLRGGLRADPAVSRDAVRTELAKLRPTARGTNLGEGLVRTAQALQEAQAELPLPCPQRVILVTDGQAGANLAALREFDWPADMPVEWLLLEPNSPENAGLQLVTSASERPDDRLRVRVSNAATSTRQQFELFWDDGVTPCLSVVVPPGQSRVVALPTPPALGLAQSVRLNGDDEPFDNRLWLPTRRPRPCTVVVLGGGSFEDPAEPAYYLQRAFGSNPRYDVTLAEGTTPLLGSAPPAVVIAIDLDDAGRELLPKLVAAGSDVVLAPRTAEAAVAIAKLCAAPGLTAVEGTGRDYVLWSDIDFESPWFAPFAEARFADFSGIHFWKSRRIGGELPAGTRTLVSFDDGTPAILQWSTAARGQVWCFASGWHPADSQLSRSSKFVPLMWRMLEEAMGAVPWSAAQSVGTPIMAGTPSTLPEKIRLPDGIEQPWPAGATEFIGTEQPGRYEVLTGTQTDVVVINLPPEESRTEPLAPEELEAQGLTLTTTTNRPQPVPRLDQLRQQQLQELEGRQQLWKWLLLGLGGCLMLETIWSRRRDAVADRVDHAGSGDTGPTNPAAEHA